jgi:hypothetical protein
VRGSVFRDPLSEAVLLENTAQRKVRLDMMNRQLKLEALENRHRGLSAQLENLMRHARPTPGEQLALLELKKKKLRAKDRIAALRQALRPQR